MAQNLAQVKTGFITQLTAFCTLLEKQFGQNDELVAYFFGNSLNSGAANALTDADVQAAAPYLTAVQVTNIVATLQALQTAMTTSQRNNLRQAMTNPLP